MAPRIIETSLTEEDQKIEGTLRPQKMDDYIGQSKAKETLKIYIEAAKRRNDPTSKPSASSVPRLSSK